MADLIALLAVLLGLASIPLLMWWLTRASRRARTAAQERANARPAPPSELAFEETTAGADGLSYGRRYDGDDALIPPDHSGGEVPGIKAMQGHR